MHNRSLRSFAGTALSLATVLLAAAALAQQPPAPSPAQLAALEQQRKELNSRPDTPGTGPCPAMKAELPDFALI